MNPTTRLTTALRSLADALTDRPALQVVLFCAFAALALAGARALDAP